jgi:hypothetical protein
MKWSVEHSQFHFHCTADAADVDLAVAAAKEAFKTWRHTKPADRYPCWLGLISFISWFFFSALF